MYKLVYFDVSEREFQSGFTLATMKSIAARNKNVYQIVRNNRDQEVVWERECPEE